MNVNVNEVVKLKSGDGGEEALGVGMGGVLGDLVGGAFLDEFAVLS